MNFRGEAFIEMSSITTNLICLLFHLFFRSQVVLHILLSNQITYVRDCYSKGTVDILSYVRDCYSKGTVDILSYDFELRAHV